MDAGAWSCCMVVCPIHDIPTVREVINRIMHEAKQLIARRLGGLVAVYSWQAVALPKGTPAELRK